jgi:DNA-binding transcriptional ArsR family regulator
MSKEVKYKDLGDSLLIKALGNSPKIRIIDIFLTNPYFDFSKEELARELGMSKQTLYKNFKDLEKLEIVKISRKVGRAVMYKINMEHPLVKRLNEIINEMSPKIAEKELEKQAKPVPQDKNKQM